MKSIVLLLSLIYLSGDKSLHRIEEDCEYIIVTGEFTCKSCVLDLFEYLYKKQRDKVSIGTAYKNVIVGGLSLAYYQKSLPNASFQARPINLSTMYRKYPTLIRCCSQDSSIYPFDSLFIGNSLNVNFIGNVIGQAATTTQQ